MGIFFAPSYTSLKIILHQIKMILFSILLILQFVDNTQEIDLIFHKKILVCNEFIKIKNHINRMIDPLHLFLFEEKKFDKICFFSIMIKSKFFSKQLLSQLNYKQQLFLKFKEEGILLNSKRGFILLFCQT